MLHVLFSDDWKYYDNSLWWFTDIVHAFVKPAVPLFVMVSRAFLLDSKREFSIGKFWLRRASRVLLPFFAWTLVYAAWSVFHDHQWPLSDFPARFMDGQVADHLWFVYMLMGLYLALPILRRFVASATQTEIIYFILLWFVAVCLAPSFPDWLENTKGYLVVATGFTGYFIGGYWLRNMNLSGRSLKFLVAAIVVVALGNTTLAHILASRSDVYLDDDDMILNDLGPSVAILSFLVFLFFRSLRYDCEGPVSRRIAWVVAVLSATSYGMYLGHPMVFRVLGSRDGLLGWHLDSHAGSPGLGFRWLSSWA